MGQKGKSSPSETVVIALSEPGHSEYVLNWFLQNLMRDQFHIVLTHVVPSPMDAGYYSTLGGFSVPSIGYAAEHLEALKNESIEAGKRYLHGQASHIKQLFPSAKVDCIISVGDARDGLLEVACDTKATMLVVGSRKMSEMQRIFLGSTSTHCVHHAECPVVVVKARFNIDEILIHWSSCDGPSPTTRPMLLIGALRLNCSPAWYSSLVTGGEFNVARKGPDLSSLKRASIVHIEPKKFRYPSRNVNTVANAEVSPAVETRLVKIRLVKQMTKNGKKATFTALVVAGNKAGGIGYGLGRDSLALDSIVKAGKIAENNMEFFERFQGRTIFHAANVKFKATKLMAKPAPANSGRRAHHAIQELCRVMGIDDISCKVYGSTNSLTVVEAFMELLRRQKTPEQVARDSGMKVVDVLKVYEHGMYSANRQTIDRVSTFTPQ